MINYFEILVPVQRSITAPGSLHSTSTRTSWETITNTVRILDYKDHDAEKEGYTLAELDYMVHNLRRFIFDKETKNNTKSNTNIPEITKASVAPNNNNNRSKTVSFNDKFYVRWFRKTDLSRVFKDTVYRPKPVVVVDEAGSAADDNGVEGQDQQQHQENAAEVVVVVAEDVGNGVDVNDVDVVVVEEGGEGVEDKQVGSDESHCTVDAPPVVNLQEEECASSVEPQEDAVSSAAEGGSGSFPSPRRSTRAAARVARERIKSCVEVFHRKRRG
jgi:hypothetical protein